MILNNYIKILCTFNKKNIGKNTFILIYSTTFDTVLLIYKTFTRENMPLIINKFN